MARLNRYMPLICIAILLPAAARSQNYSDADRLVTRLLTGYNTDVRPLNNQSKTLVVNISINVFQLTEVDVVKGMISMTTMAIMSWYDDRIVWDPADFGGINTVLIRHEKVWSPNLACASPFSEVDEVGDTFMKVRFSPDGRASYTPGDIVKSSCSFDVSYWPFDRQECGVSFMAFGYLETEVDLNLVHDGVFFERYIEHGEWDVVASSAVDQSFNGMDHVNFIFQLKRRSGFFVLNIILPIVGVMIMSPMVFLLPSESGERIGYSITVLLSIAVFFTIISDNLPTSSAPMAKIISFITVGLGSSMVIGVSIILNLRIYHRTDVALPPWAIGVVRLSRGQWSRSSQVDIHAAAAEHQTCNTTETGVNNVNPEEKHASVVTKVGTPSDKLEWKDVSIAIDKILFITFCVIILGTTGTFLSVLASADH